MSTFGRTPRQDVLWGLFNAIRAIIDKGLLSPEEGLEEGDPLIALHQPTWDAYETGYAAIHTANDTIG